VYAISMTDIDLAAENERLRAENATLLQRVSKLEARVAELEVALAAVKGQPEEARRAGKRRTPSPSGERGAIRLWL